METHEPSLFRHSPFDLEVYELTETIDPGDPLPETVPGFEASSGKSYPVRIREHRFDESDDLILVGRTTEAAKTAER